MQWKIYSELNRTELTDVRTLPASCVFIKGIEETNVIKFCWWSVDSQKGPISDRSQKRCIYPGFGLRPFHKIRIYTPASWYSQLTLRLTIVDLFFLWLWCWSHQYSFSLSIKYTAKILLTKLVTPCVYEWYTTLFTSYYYLCLYCFRVKHEELMTGFILIFRKF